MSRYCTAVISTGLANIASVLAALKRAGADPFLTDSPTDVACADYAVLPGVGAFGPAMERLHQTGLRDAIAARVGERRPLLCICLGMQLLCRDSAESPGISGLGIVDESVTRFGSGVRVPELGWNHVEAPKNAHFLRSGYAYFANSFRVTSPPGGVVSARTEYGGSFVSALERGPLLACQFHPELSGAWGHDLIRRWLTTSVHVSQGHASWSEQGSTSGLARRVIPCLDCREGRVVKGVKFQQLRDAGDPAELAAAYEAQGADELVLLDVSATPEGRRTAYDTVRRVRAQLSIPLTVGGGVRTADDAQALLEAGADKVGVNSAAVANPALISDIAERFGRQCAVLALDAAQVSPGAWEVVVQSGKVRTGKDAVQWAKEAAARGTGEILLTSWDRDGTRQGYDCDLLRAVCGSVHVPVIASGGAATPAHLHDALKAGAEAVLAASIFHDGEYSVAQVKEFLAARGVAVRR